MTAVMAPGCQFLKQLATFTTKKKNDQGDIVLFSYDGTGLLQ
jgi:hypothetical protein